MRFVIYELVKGTPRESYKNYHTSLVYPFLLERLDEEGIEEEHSSMESAIEEIKRNRNNLTSTKLTILPIFCLLYTSPSPRD